MAASRSSLAKFFRLPPTNVLAKSPPKTHHSSPSPSTSMSKSKLSHTSRSTSRRMDDSDDDFSSFFRSRRHPPPSPMTLVAFYDGSGTPDGSGRTLEEILQWDTERLERSHDYIQTLFPLPEKSGVNDMAPIINKEVFDAFRGREELRRKLREAFEKMLWFYGFELVEEEGKLAVRPGPNIEPHSEFWNTRFDHNHLRITRIIRCLRVLGLEKEALAFYDTMSCADSVSSRSRMYWKRAAYRQLNISPDIEGRDADPEDRRIGPRFLFEFEQERKEAEKMVAEKREKEDAEKAVRAGQGEGEGETANTNTERGSAADATLEEASHTTAEGGSAADTISDEAAGKIEGATEESGER